MVGKVAVERTERLRRLCKSIVAEPHNVDGDTKAKLQTAALKYAATQYVDTTQALKNLYHDESELGVLLRKAVEVVADHDAPDDPLRAPVSDHHASRVADLLVEAGSHPDRAAALHHLLHKPSGQALLARMSKAAETAKDTTMSTSEHLDAIVKRFGPVQFAKHIVDTGKAPCSEHELVMSLSRHVGGDAAFSKLFEGEESVRRACAIAKAMPFVADLTPLVVGTPAAMHQAVDDTEQSEALAQLKQLGRDKWPTATEAQAFANAFLDPANAELARKAHVRPSPTTSFPFPR